MYILYLLFSSNRVNKLLYYNVFPGQAGHRFKNQRVLLLQLIQPPTISLKTRKNLKNLAEIKGRILLSPL